MTLPAFAVDVATAVLGPVDLDPSQVLDGDPQVSELTLDTSPDGRVVRGIWQITPGVSTDVEADELFVVISGRATVEIEDGATLDLRPGTLGVLRAGDRTTWRVEETLRKVYQVTVEGSGSEG
ncbi:cupin domain-containing protein [Patulibacter defluvii]|uniref:cupin domain-containing protein n=1 Tax=Patulibacter defluvii TaxID=3095358 RepID=UPI002A74AA55|nr:cupin domain-containing protein [Patulibacter sp. DM4]